MTIRQFPARCHRAEQCINRPPRPSLRLLPGGCSAPTPRLYGPCPVTLVRVNPVRRGAEVFQRRFPRTYLASGVLAFAAFTLWDAVRLWHSPIRGTAAFDAGTYIGLGFGLAAAVAWVVTLYRARPGARFAWWQWTTASLWFVALVTAHSKASGGGEAAVTNAYTVAALWYEIAAFVGFAATLAMVLTRGGAVAGKRF